MSEKKIYRESEVTGKKDKSTWLIIHDNVYDVTKFLEEVSNKLITSQYLDWSKSRTVTSIMSISQRFQCQFEKFYVIFLWMIWMVDRLKWILGDFFFQYSPPQVNIPQEIVQLHVSFLAWLLLFKKLCIRFLPSSPITDVRSQLNILNAPNQC